MVCIEEGFQLCVVRREEIGDGPNLLFQLLQLLFELLELLLGHCSFACGVVLMAD